MFKQISPGTGLLDADHAAGMEGMIRATKLENITGIGAVAVSNSSHFGATAYFAFRAAI